MSECGICGSAQKRLYCGGCAMHATLRGRVNVIKVSTQLSGLRASVTEALEGPGGPGGGGGGAGAGAGAGHCGNEARTEQLQAKIALLQRRLDRTHQAVTACHDKTQELRQQHQLVQEQAAALRQSHAQIERQAERQYDAHRTARGAREALLEQGYRDMLQLSLSLQSKCCQNLLELFTLRKKRKKAGYEFVLGHNVMPDLTQLGSYSVVIINSGIERVSMFVGLLASYLALRLPYQIVFPQKGQPKTLIGAVEPEPLSLQHSVKLMMRTSPREFHHYCRLLAMLAHDVAHVGCKLGVPSVTDVQDVAKLNQLVAQICLRIESIIKSGHQIQTLSSDAAVVDIDALQDYLISRIDIEMNGKSAEWNIIDAPVVST